MGQLTAAGGETITPHPTASTITHVAPPNATVAQEYGRLGVAHPLESFPGIATFDTSRVTRYSLYAGGPKYDSVAVVSNLSNVDLRPTPENPLGIFHNTGTVTLGDDVTIVGTLACTMVVAAGKRIDLSAFDGETLFVGATAAERPRAFAVICEAFRIEPAAQLSVDGGVLCAGTFRRKACMDAKVGSGSSGDLTAVVAGRDRPTVDADLNQPFSLANSLTNTHDVFVLDGTRQTRHPIRGVDDSADRLTIVGDWPNGAALTLRIVPRQTGSAEIRGQLLCERIAVETPEEWLLDASRWTQLHDNFVVANTQAGGALRFHEWLADRNNHPFSWSYLYHYLYGLSSDPTFQIESSIPVRRVWQWPLLSPAAEPAAEAGYRWVIESWNLPVPPT